MQSAKYLKWESTASPMLNPMDRGVIENETRDVYEEKFPEFYDEWMNDPFHVRFPGGESYHDLVVRLEPIVVEIESKMCPVVVISHVSVLQVLYCYFLGVPVHQSMSLKVPKHEVIQLLPTVGGALNEQRYVPQEGSPGLHLLCKDSFSILLTAEQEKAQRTPTEVTPLKPPNTLYRRTSLVEFAAMGAEEPSSPKQSGLLRRGHVETIT
eukprot:c14854_g1_i1.p1 GENE.c14854_g1_i1~~c14854_g1_i1.p1  ORF type:complete len:210 (+),score=45.90 c14854_g1_i1:2-631(+)